MKKISLLLVLSLSLFALSCKKKGCIDESAINYNADAKKDDGSCEYASPTITIIGDNPVNIGLNSTYNDEGATAVDYDGKTLTVNTDASQVNTSELGTYEVVYTATSEHGIATAKRLVNIVINQSVYLGTYSIDSDCGAFEFPLSSESTVIAGTSSTQLFIENAFNLLGGQIALVIDGQNITVPAQSINVLLGDINFSGSGVMNASGTEMTIIFDYDGPLGAGTCTATYTKQ